MNGIGKTGNMPVPQRQMTPERERELRKACAGFEAMLAYSLLKTMRRSLPAGGILPRSSSRESYESMLDQRIADTVARKGQGIGLQKVLYDHITKQYRKIDSSSAGNASINSLAPPADGK